MQKTLKHTGTNPMYEGWTLEVDTEADDITWKLTLLDAKGKKVGGDFVDPEEFLDHLMDATTDGENDGDGVATIMVICPDSTRFVTFKLDEVITLQDTLEKVIMEMIE